MSALTGVSWLAIIISSVVAFALGAVWYSPKMFSVKWRQGIGSPVVPNRPMGPSMVVQFIGTFLLAWAMIAAAPYSMALAVLIALATTALIKANGFFAGKTIYAIATEAGYVAAQAIIILLAYQLFK